jgi:hypothetical protein
MPKASPSPLEFSGWPFLEMREDNYNALMERALDGGRFNARSAGRVLGRASAMQ